jgi:hypothetical protein
MGLTWSVLSFSATLPVSVNQNVIVPSVPPASTNLLQGLKVARKRRR